MESANPFSNLKKHLNILGKEYSYYSLPDLKDPRLEKLPYSIRVLLEAAVRNCDDFNVKPADVQTILNWSESSLKEEEIPFKPARVLLQDLTGVPAVVDLAILRDAYKNIGGDPIKINPLCPVELVIDHSVQVDYYGTKDAIEKNESIEFKRNHERFEFLKWGAKAFKNLLIVPPGSGIVHQVNLEYLGRAVFNENGLLYPDSVVGTDSHTTMINGLGVVGWGVGGIEAEAVMLGQQISLVLPQVVGFKLTGKLQSHVNATDLVLTITQMLRKRGVVGKFVEYFGSGCNTLSLADRATIANMAPEYGATIGFFPVDNKTIDYLRTTARSEEQIKIVEEYLKAQNMFREYDGSQVDPEYTGEVLELDLSLVEPSVAGPKRPHDRVPLKDVKADFTTALTNKLGFKGFAVKEESKQRMAKFVHNGNEHELKHGSVVIAAITSCTNTSNPEVMLGAGLLAKNAVEKGLSVAPYVKTSLSPGSHVVTKYYEQAGVYPYLDKLGFSLTGFGCMTCIGNSGEIDVGVAEAIVKEDLVAAAVLSGNRNFEGRVHPLTKANYLCSPPLVVAYALAGRVDIDFKNEPIGKGSDGNDVFLKDIWPSRDQISEVIEKTVRPESFKEIYDTITHGKPAWNELKPKEGTIYEWSGESTYIHQPPYFNGMTIDPPAIKDIKGAYCLLNLGDSITTDHISPAGNIAKNSPAARYLIARGIEQKDFNTYGARRGNDEVMVRGTFANVRLINKMMEKVGPQTIHVPTNKAYDIYDAAALYQSEGHPTIILAGQEYGSGSSRDWAAKGPLLQGVKAVITQSFERIHRSNLIGMGILPLQFKQGESADTLGLTGLERFDIPTNNGDLKIGQDITIRTDGGKEFQVKVRLDTEPEIAYYKNGGILHYVLRKLLKQSQ